MKISLDTNVLVYAVDADAGDKHAMAAALLRKAAEADCVLTLQSLAEFFYTATRRQRMPLDDAQELIAEWREAFSLHAADETALDQAIDAVRDHKLGFWDALLWATARQAGCRAILSEDFQDGRRLGGVTFLNPFDPKNSSAIDDILSASRDGTE